LFGGSGHTIQGDTWLFYSDINNVSQQQSQSELKLSPNPATDFLEISYSDHALKDLAIRIYNVFGEEVLTTHLTPSPSPKEKGVRIDVSGLVPGMYFVRVWEKVGKFVKM